MEAEAQTIQAGYLKAYATRDLSLMREEINTLRQLAYAHGARDSHNDCIAGDITSGPNGEGRVYVCAYVHAARHMHAYVHGPMLREYYIGST